MSLNDEIQETSADLMAAAPKLLNMWREWLELQGTIYETSDNYRFVGDARERQMEIEAEAAELVTEL